MNCLPVTARQRAVASALAFVAVIAGLCETFSLWALYKVLVVLSSHLVIRIWIHVGGCPIGFLSGTGRITNKNEAFSLGV